MIDCTFELNDKPMSAFKLGAPSFPAFSGLKGHVNRRSSVCIPNFGPIPLGKYHIFDRQSGGLLGPLRDLFTDRDEWFALYAIDEKIDDETYCEKVKRGLFRLHPKGPFGVSKGCIVIDNWSEFQTVKSLLKKTETKIISETGLESYGTVTVK